MEGGAARNHLERRIREGSVFGTTMLEANIAKAAVTARKPRHHTESLTGAAF